MDGAFVLPSPPRITFITPFLSARAAAHPGCTSEPQLDPRCPSWAVPSRLPGRIHKVGRIERPGRRMTETLRIVAAVGGVVLIVGMLSDAVATLIVTQGSSGLWRPTRLFYAATWRGARTLAARLPDRAGEYVLNVYPALSLLGLLVLWLAGLMLGWSLVYWGLDQHVGGTRDWGSLVYYAGTSLVTPVFGSAHGALVRMLTLLETLTGVVTIALDDLVSPCALRRVQPERGPPAHARRSPRRAHHPGTRHRHRRPGWRCRDAVPLVGGVADVDSRRAREPRVVPDAGALSVSASGTVLGHRARRRDRRGHLDVGLCGRSAEPGAVLCSTGEAAAPSWRSRAACTCRRR